MKSKSKLIPKSKMWISLLLIFLPIVSLIIGKIIDLDITKDIAKDIAKTFASFSLIGMFLLFMTQWTKDDGDEMYLKFRLIACVGAIVFSLGFIFFISIFNIFSDKLGMDAQNYSAHSILFMMFLWMLYTLGFNIYKAKKELNND